GGALFNAEFGIRHRAAPYRKGQVLHSDFAAALFNFIRQGKRNGPVYCLETLSDCTLQSAFLVHLTSIQ
ncbi:hypothetical protein, partial [Pseudomonas sp.]|uniref:hypothetical protein n=1 Tax=Pseudomonas sp. TaxID=306 RepID=UPI00257D77EB